MADHGYAPYEEAAAQGQARMSTLQRLGQLFAGAGQGIALSRLGQNPLESALLGFSGGYGAANQARQAAEQYAMRKIEADRAEEERQTRIALANAQIENYAKQKPPEPPKKTKRQEAEETLGRPLTEDEAKMIAGVYQKPETPSSTDVGIPMDDATLDMTAKVYLETGQLPPMGMGAKGAQVRGKVLQRAAQMMPGADVAQNKATYGANQRALTALTMNLESVNAFAETAHANGEILKQTLARVPDWGTRWGNRVSRWAASQAGSPQVAQFHTALEVVTPEFARILQQGNITGAMLTDTARKELRAVLSGDYTKQQLLASLDILYRDNANRQKSYSNQIRDLKNRMSFRSLRPDTTASDPLGVR